MVVAEQSKTPRHQHPLCDSVKTTKVVVGIDAADGYIPVVDLLGRLRVQKPMLTLLHAVNPRCPLENIDAHIEAEYSKVMENIGLRALDASIDEACSRDMRSRTRLAFGRAANVLMQEAEESQADLIAIRALKHGTWTSGYLGSATCALATTSSASLLIAKKPIQHHRPLRAVMAVDHSARTPQIVQKFLTLNASGITDILVLTSYEVDDETAKTAHRNLAMPGGDVDGWLSELLLEKNEGIRNELAEHGYNAQSKVINGTPDDGIRLAMQEFHADLLIIGGTGSGSAPSAKIGSTALHQITAEPYSILLLR